MTIEAYEAPVTIEAALAAMEAQGAGAIYLAGGSIALRGEEPRAVVDLGRIEDLSGISKSTRTVTIGATTRYANLKRASALYGAHHAIVDAVAGVADRQIRNVATIGGALAARDAASCIPCVALALGAAVLVQAAGGAEERVPVAGYLGRPAGADGLVLGLGLARESLRAGSAYRRHGETPGGLPVIGVAAFLETDETGACTTLRLAAGGAALPAPLVSDLSGVALGLRRDPGRFAEIAGGFADGIAAPGNRWASAAFRATLIRAMGRRALLGAYRRGFERRARGLS